MNWQEGSSVLISCWFLCLACLSHFPVDVSPAALPMQVPPAATAILPMDLRVDHHHNHQQQPTFGLVSQPHPTPPSSTSSEPGRCSVISKSLGGAYKHTWDVLVISGVPKCLQTTRSSSCSRSWWLSNTSNSCRGSYWSLSSRGSTNSYRASMRSSCRSTSRWLWGGVKRPVHLLSIVVALFTSTNRTYWHSSTNRSCWSTRGRLSSSVMNRSWRSSSGNTNSISSRTRTGDRRVRITARSTCETPLMRQVDAICLFVVVKRRIKVTVFDFNCTPDAASTCSQRLTFSSAGVGAQTHAWPGGSAVRTGATSHLNPGEYLRLRGAAWSLMRGPRVDASSLFGVWFCSWSFQLLLYCCVCHYTHQSYELCDAASTVHELRGASVEMATRHFALIELDG